MVFTEQGVATLSAVLTSKMTVLTKGAEFGSIVSAVTALLSS